MAPSLLADAPARPPTAPATGAPPGPRPAPARPAFELAGILAWAVLVTVAVAWGRASVAHRPVGLGAAPLVGSWDLRLTGWALPTIAFGGAAVAAGPVVAQRWPWRRVPIAAGGAAATWATLLSITDGPARFAAPLTNRHDYLPFAQTIDSPRAFLRGYVAAAPDLPTHVKGHPPGATLLFWALDRVTLGHPVGVAAFVVAAWGGAIALVLVAAREVAGERSARAAAPAVALVPGAVWAGTSGDALFAALAAASVAALVIALVRRQVPWALLGGAVGGVAILCSYGLALAAAIPLAVAWSRRRGRELVPAALAVGAVVALAAAGGFWWPDGLAATRTAYWRGLALVRPLGYLTFVGNPAALALAVGPATAAGLAALRTRHRVAPLVAGAGAAVVAADVSLMSLGEVERIWLPFVPWLALATAAAPRRRWLAIAVLGTLVLQVSLRSPW